MKQILFLLLAFPFLANSDCHKKEKKNDSSTVGDNTTSKDTGQLLPCLQQRIDSLNKHNPPDGPVRVEEYTYQGKTVYLFTAPCCDQFNVLYDSNCTMMCAPSGGFTGRGDGKCPDFDKTAKLIRTVYEQKQK